MFDKAGRVIATRNPLNERTTTVYDAAGQTIAGINPLGFRSTTVYDPAGRTRRQVTPLGFITTTLYDLDSRTIASVNPLNQRWTTAYDAASQPVRQVDPLLHITTTSYDAAGQPVAVRNALSEVSTTVYDAAGRAVSRIDPLLRRSTTVYDPVGNATAQVNPLNERSTTVYDAANRAVSNIDPLLHRTTSVYDAAGQALATVNALGYRTSNVYDAAGRQTALVDARTHRVTTLYNAASEAIANINPLLQRVTSAYDAASRRTLRIDARNNRTTYVYDAGGRMTKRRYPDGTRTTWTYDPVDNPLVVNATNGIFTRTFDPLSRLSQLIWPSEEIYTWTYDAIGQRRTRRASDVSPGITSYAYDAVGRMSSLINEHSERTTYSYDQAGQETRKLLDNGVRVTTTYDGAGRIRSVRNYDSTNAVISLYTYTYDSAGNRKSEWADDGVRTTYTYDNANQLTQELRETSGLSWGSLTADDWSSLTADGWSTLGAGINDGRQHVYDPTGNRLLEIANGERTTFAYNAANQPIYKLSNEGRTTYTYDPDGNQQLVEEPTGDITTNTWSYENQLSQVELPDEQVITYLYAPVTLDSTELRTAREDEAGNVNYVYDANNLIRELDETYNVENIYTLNPMPYGDLVSQNREGDSIFHLFDALGSTRQLTDDSQTTTDNYDYSAYGLTLSQTGSTKNTAQWVGELGYYKEEVTGDHILSERFYRNMLIAFLSKDPLKSRPNLYPYASNDPVNRVDPSGLEDLRFISISVWEAENCSCPTAPEGNKATNYQLDLTDILPTLTTGNDPEWGHSGLSPEEVKRIDGWLAERLDATAAFAAPNLLGSPATNPSAVSRELFRDAASLGYGIRFQGSTGSLPDWIDPTPRIGAMTKEVQENIAFEERLLRDFGDPSQLTPEGAKARQYRIDAYTGNKWGTRAVEAELVFNALLLLAGAAGKAGLKCPVPAKPQSKPVRIRMVAQRTPRAVIGAPLPRTLSNIQARDWYNEQVAHINEIEKQMRADGKSLKEIFETTTYLRNKAKLDARELMIDQHTAKSLPPPKTPDEILQKYGGDYEKAIEASKRTNAEVNNQIENRRNQGER